MHIITFKGHCELLPVKSHYAYTHMSMRNTKCVHFAMGLCRY